jgi:thiosulfate dehydrogenase [quinone] large subunit
MSTAARTYQRVFQSEQVGDPGIVKTIFGSPKMSLIWTPIRMYVGWQWLTAGIEKINQPAWTQSGTALKGFWANATKLDAGAKGAAIHYGWYHDFLKYMLDNSWYTWFAKLIAFGEAAIGIALILGAFVGFAAFFGAMMNFNFMLAGSASINPVLFGLAVLLILAWKVAGFIGADYYLLRAFGTPWKPGHMADPALHREQPRQHGFGQTALGVAAFLAAFGIAGVVTVVANNQWAEEAPVVGYLVAMAAVVAAWIATEAVVLYTHTFGVGEETPVTLTPGAATQ